MATATVETLQFQAETKQLLDLMIHSLYSNKEIFLRELISNASDAIDRLRFEALTHPELLEGDEKLEIRLEADRNARTLTIHDNGIGMSRDEVVDNIGTIAKSGTRELVERMKQGESQQTIAELIGQFGVGFYSSFMVADRVELVTRRAGETAGHALGVDRRRHLHHRGGREGRPRHHDHPPPQARGQRERHGRLLRPLGDQPHRPPLLGLRRLPDHPHRREGPRDRGPRQGEGDRREAEDAARGEDPQLDEADLDAPAVRGHERASTTSSTATSRTTGPSRSR